MGRKKQKLLDRFVVMLVIRESFFLYDAMVFYRDK